MRHVRIFHCSLSLALFAFCALSGFGSARAQNAPVIHLHDNAPINVQKLPWEFYWKRYLYPGDFANGRQKPDITMPKATIWNHQTVAGAKLGSFGYATYRLQITIKTKGARLAMRFATPLTSYRIFINGQLLAEAGTLTMDEAGFVGKRKSPLVHFSAPDQNLEIIVHVSNFVLYKGGLRDSIEIGYADDMEDFSQRFLAIDVFCTGLIFAIMLYHFLLYLLSRKNRAILIFAMLSLDYFLLASLYGDRSILLFFPDISLELQVRLASGFGYVLPALVIEFTGTLYEGTISKFARNFFWVVAIIFVALLILPTRYCTFYNVFYYGLTGSISGLICLFGILRAARDQRAGARLLMFGIFVLFALTLYAVYLYATHTQAGSFLSIGFSLFALAQSGSLAHAHAALTRENNAMHDRLERSRSALENQRKQIEANLHDSLGGNLTDVKLALEALQNDPRAKAMRSDIRRLDHRVAGTIASLRTELLFLEDLQLAMKDFVSGINLILLRRYQMAKKPVDIRVDPQTRELSKQLETSGFLNDEVRPELCLMVQELCNNSLKYTSGIATWEIQATRDSLKISVRGKSRTRAYRQGLGRETLRTRAHRIKARFEESLNGGVYEASVSLP